MDDHGTRRRRASAIALLLVLASLALAGCGSSSSGGPTTLLRQTFSGPHRVTSGRLSFVLTINPEGSSTFKSPISLTFGGPFQSLGAGKLPQSSFNLSVNAFGRSVGVGILSTGTNGYVSFQGANYPLPQAEFQKLESSFSSLASTPGTSGSGILGKLGIQPLHWLQHPQVVGDENVGGTTTTHIRAGINVAALLSDFNTFLGRASSLGVSGASSFPHGLSQASIARVATAIRSPSFDVWTGKSDKTIRRVQIGLTLPVTGQISTLFGGIHAAGVGLSLEYADVNQPQSITAPTSLAPFSQLQSRLRTYIATLESGIGGALGLGTGSASGASPSSPSSSATLNSYSRCIQAAGNDVAKMQQCASLLSGK